MNVSVFQAPVETSEEDGANILKVEVIRDCILAPGSHHLFSQYWTSKLTFVILTVCKM